MKIVLNFLNEDFLFRFPVLFLSIFDKTQVRCVAPLQCDDEGNKLVVPPTEVGS